MIVHNLSSAITTFLLNSLIMSIWLSESDAGGALTTQDEAAETFQACTENALVVSEVFCLPSDYRKDVPPPIDGPIDVYFKIPVSEISKIDDQRSQISIRWTYKLKWPEPRMILNSSADWSTGEINVRGDMVDHFWTPDIIIHDLVSFYKPEILNQVAALEIKSRKQLYFKVRSDMTMVCKGMKFSRFPLDEHVCFLKLTSFGYDDRRMMLDGQFSYDSTNQRALPFNVVISEISEEMKVYHGSTSNYSVYGLEIRLSRCVSPYLLNVYLPTAIFVVMSWVSFLIPTDVVPARIVLVVTLCLVIINTFNNVTARIPVASQVTALEIWLLACILLVFGALAEYAFILRQVINLSRRQRRLRHRLAMEYGDTVAGNNYAMQQIPMPDVFAPNAGLLGAAASASGQQQQQQQQQQSNGSKDEWSGDQKPTRPQQENLQVSLETHQTERGATTVATTATHHIHDMQDERTTLTHRSVGSGTSSHKIVRGGNNRNDRRKGVNNCRNKKTHEQLMIRYQEHVDGKALVIFPVAFLLFNIGYWCHYLLNL